MVLLLPWTPGPQRAPTSPHRRWRRWLRSTPTCWAPWLEELQTVASGSACWPASAASTSFATRSASLWQRPPNCSLTWCTSTRAWGSAWEPWCADGTREAQVNTALNDTAYIIVEMHKSSYFLLLHASLIPICFLGLLYTSSPNHLTLRVTLPFTLTKNDLLNRVAPPATFFLTPVAESLLIKSWHQPTSFLSSSAKHVMYSSHAKFHNDLPTQSAQNV